MTTIEQHLAEREILSLTNRIKELEDAIVEMNPIAPAVFVAHGAMPALRNAIIARRAELAAVVFEQ